MMMCICAFMFSSIVSDTFIFFKTVNKTVIIFCVIMYGGSQRHFDSQVENDDINPLIVMFRDING